MKIFSLAFRNCLNISKSHFVSIMVININVLDSHFLNSTSINALLLRNDFHDFFPPFYYLLSTLHTYTPEYEWIHGHVGQSQPLITELGQWHDVHDHSHNHLFYNTHVITKKSHVPLIVFRIIKQLIGNNRYLYQIWRG